MRKFILILMLLAALAAGLSSLPLRWAAGFIGPSADKAALAFGGNLWNGFASLPDGNGYVDIKTRPLSIVKGQLPMAFKTRGTPFVAAGRAGWGRMSEVRISAPLQALVKRDARLYGLSGNTVMTVSDLDLRGECSASGTVVVDDIAMDYPGWKWQGPQMSGPIVCKEGVMIFDLSGKQAGDDIRLRLGVDRQGGYDVQLSFSTRELGAEAALPLMGFENRSGVWTLVEKGRWQ